MLPTLTSRNNNPSSTLISKRRKDVRSPKTDRAYQSEVLSNHLSPRQKFRPIDFRENVIISINSSEALRVKEYEKL